MPIMNRNTSPISPFDQELMAKVQEASQAHLYPDAEKRRFLSLYAELNDLPLKELEVANGSDDWIQKLMIVYGGEGVLTLAPDFFMYQDYAGQLDRRIDFVLADDKYDFDLGTILKKIEALQPGFFIFSNPHNPTGTQFSEDFVQALADKMAEIGGKLVIDEAYIEFGQDYKRPEGDHVIILRTLSKIYGMAGLRIGVLQASGQTYQDMVKINHPYPVNSLSLNLASAFIEDQDKREAFFDYQLQSKDELVKAFSPVAEKIKMKPSQANYIFTYGEDALSLGRYLADHGFQARFYQEKEGIPDVVRYSIIALEDYPELNRLIQEWSKENVD